MSYRLEIRLSALADIDEAAEWYAQRQEGLGTRFVCPIRSAISSLQTNPLIYRVRHRRLRVRWFLPPRFPYRIVYRVDGDLIVILGVIHSARHDRE